MPRSHFLFRVFHCSFVCFVVFDASTVWHVFFIFFFSNREHKEQPFVSMRDAQNELSSLRDARDAEGDEELQSMIAVTVLSDLELLDMARAISTKAKFLLRR